MQIINPATEEIIREIQEDNAETLRKNYELLKEAQRNGSLQSIWTANKNSTAFFRSSWRNRSNHWLHTDLRSRETAAAKPQ